MRTLFSKILLQHHCEARLRPIILAVSCLMVLTITAPVLCQDNLTAEQWRQDISYYLEEVPRVHIDCFHTVSPDTFRNALEDLRARVSSMQHADVVVELARITAMIGDGHSVVWLTPNSANRFRQYAIQLYWMEGDMYVLGIDAKHDGVVGGRLLRIDDVSADDAFARVAPLVSRDNDMGVKRMAPRYLAIPEVLHAVGIAASPDRARYSIEKPDGEVETVTHDAVPDAWLSHLSPYPFLIRKPSDSVDFTFVYDANGPPAWLQYPTAPFWDMLLPDSQSLYVQLNIIRDFKQSSMHGYFERLLRRADSLRPSRLILDLRLNGGGNNMLNLPVILELVRRPWLDQRGKLFALISRHTFSAAADFVTKLEQLTNTVFVGEPTGGSPNSFGDAATVILPNSGLRVRVSTIYWQSSLPEQFETRSWTPPDIAAPQTIESFRASTDPGLEAILSWTPQPPLVEQLRVGLEEGGIARAEEVHRQFRFDPSNRWIDNEAAINSLGYALLSEHRSEEAAAIMRLNTLDHPESANAFDSYGEALLARGDTTAAVTAWREALRLEPAFAVPADNLRSLGIEP